jgi:hypothetical protein
VPDPGESPQDRAYRVGFKRQKREDYAVDLFRLARASAMDIPEVNRILGELGRFYNAIADAPLVSLETRRRVIASLEAGRTDEAVQLIDDCLARYLVREED